MKLYQKIFTALLLVFAAAPLAAQDESCDGFSAMDQLVGDYEITNGPGQLINVPNVGTIPGPATATLTAKLFLMDGNLVLDSKVFGDLDVGFKVVTDPNEKWGFSDNDTFQSISSNDFASAHGCASTANFTRLLGTGTTQLPNVGSKPATMRLIVFPSKFIVGRMDVEMQAPITLQTRILMVPEE